MFARSPFLQEHYELFGKYQVRYTLGGEEFDHVYYAADSIYDPLGLFLQPVPAALARRGADFDEHALNDKQEFCRKDIERAFGMILKRFKILRDCSKRRKKLMGLILKCCIILHNLILDDERGLVLEDVLLNDESPASSIFQHDPERQPLAAHQQFADSHDLAEHIRLRYAVARELYKP